MRILLSNLESRNVTSQFAESMILNHHPALQTVPWELYWLCSYSLDPWIDPFKPTNTHTSTTYWAKKTIHRTGFIWLQLYTKTNSLWAALSTEMKQHCSCSLNKQIKVEGLDRLLFKSWNRLTHGVLCQWWGSSQCVCLTVLTGLSPVELNLIHFLAWCFKATVWSVMTPSP